MSLWVSSWRLLTGAFLTFVLIGVVVSSLVVAAPGLVVCVPLGGLCWFARNMSWESEFEQALKGARK